MNKLLLIVLLSPLLVPMPYMHDTDASGSSDEESTDQSMEFGSDAAMADPTSRFLSTNILSGTAGDSFSPQLAVSGSNVYVVWQDATPGNSEIFFRASYDKGANFEDVINLSNNAGSSSNPQLAVSGSNVYLVWDDTTPGNLDIFFTRSTDSGVSFSPAINLSNTAGGSFNPEIAGAGSNVYVVWTDDIAPPQDVFFTRSTDSGVSFSPVINLSNTAQFESFVKVAASGSNVYVTWATSEIFLRRSTDNGLNFDPVINLSNTPAINSGALDLAVSGSKVFVVYAEESRIAFTGSTDSGANFDPAVSVSGAGISSQPDMALSGSNVYVVWGTNPGFDIFSARSTNGGANFGCAINLSNNAGDSLSPQLAVSGSSVYVVWQDDTPGNREIFFKRNVDTFPSFCDVNNLSINAGGSTLPQTAVSGANVYVVWQDNTLGNNEIFFMKSTNNGATFDLFINLSNNAGSSINPQIAVSGSKVYVVWQDTTPGNSDVFFRRSTDNGLNFDPVINLSNNAGGSFDPQVALSGSKVYVVWRDLSVGTVDILFRRSTNSGASFSPFINLSNNVGGATTVQLAVSSSNVYVVWTDNTPGNYDVFFRRSTDNGANFDPVINLSNNAGVAQRVQVAVSGTNVYVLWEDTTPGNEDIFFRRSIDNGLNFDPFINLSNTAGLSFLPQLAVSGTNVYVVWQDDAPVNKDAFFRRSIDNGANFDPKVNLSTSSGNSIEPQIAVSSSKVYVVWRDDTSGNYDIYFRTSTKSGSSFGITNNLSNNAGSSESPQVAAVGVKVYVVWQDNTPGNNDIFFRANW
jgi:hypothetical protein